MTDTSTKYDNYTFDDIYEEVDDPEDPEVLLAIAHHYRNGIDTDADNSKYLDYLQRASDAGNSKAQIELAECKSSQNKSQEDRKEENSSDQSVIQLNPNQPLTGNETMDDLIKLADDGNYYACLQLLKKADNYHDNAAQKKYLNKLDKYINNGQTADPNKADIALQLGNYYMGSNLYNCVGLAKKCYDAARELGSEEAVRKLIDILCDWNDPVSAETLLEGDSEITGADRIGYLLSLDYAYFNHGNFKLKVIGIADSILKSEYASDDQKESAAVLKQISENGWNSLFQYADQPEYLRQIIYHFTKPANVQKMNQDEFIKMLAACRKVYPDKALKVLEAVACYGTYETTNAVYETPEFTDGTLINFMRQNHDTSNGYYAAEREYRQLKEQRRAQFELNFKENINNPDNYDKVKKMYDSPDDLKKITPKNLKALIQLYTDNNDYQALDHLLLNAIRSEVNSNYFVVIASKEFRSGALIDSLLNNQHTGNNEADRYVKAAIDHYDASIYRVINYFKKKKAAAA